MNKCTDCKKSSWNVTYTDSQGQPQDVTEVGCYYRVSYFGRDTEVEITECDHYVQEV